MHHGITFRGRHSDEFNVAVKTVGRPITPPVKQEDEAVSYRDGNIDFSEAGGRLYYEDKVLELEFSIIAVSTTRLNITVSRIASWLSGGYGELVFDDMPFVFWLAKPADIDDLTINLYRNGKTKVQFRCRPFNKWVFDSKGIPLDCDYPLDSDIPIGLGDENEIVFSANTTRVLNYAGTAPVRPVIKIELANTVTRFSISVNGVKAQRIAAGQNFEIDCSSAVMPAGFKGDFCELLPGENEIKIESTGGGGAVIFEYRHNFLYGDGF